MIGSSSGVLRRKADQPVQRHITGAEYLVLSVVSVFGWPLVGDLAHAARRRFPSGGRRDRSTRLHFSHFSWSSTGRVYFFRRRGVLLSWSKTAVGWIQGASQCKETGKITTPCRLVYEVDVRSCSLPYYTCEDFRGGSGPVHVCCGSAGVREALPGATLQVHVSSQTRLGPDSACVRFVLSSSRERHRDEDGEFYEEKRDTCVGGVAPREGNREANSLANGNHEGFSDERRMHVQPGKLQWIVLPQVLIKCGKQAEEVFRQARESGEPPKRNRWAGSAEERTGCVSGTRGEHRVKRMIYISSAVLVTGVFSLQLRSPVVVLSCAPSILNLFRFLCTDPFQCLVVGVPNCGVDPGALSSSNWRASFDSSPFVLGPGQFTVCPGPSRLFWYTSAYFGRPLWGGRGLASPTLRAVVPSGL